MLNERGGIRNVLVHADRLRGTLAITVTATVVGHHRKRFGQPGYDKVPVVVRSPSPMHTDERHLPVTAYLVEEPGPVDICCCQLAPPAFFRFTWSVLNSVSPSASSSSRTASSP